MMTYPMIVKPPREVRDAVMLHDLRDSALVHDDYQNHLCICRLDRKSQEYVARAERARAEIAEWPDWMRRNLKPTVATAAGDPPPGLDGPACPFCGGLTRWAGSCHVCSQCGETTGCG